MRHPIAENPSEKGPAGQGWTKFEHEEMFRINSDAGFPTIVSRRPKDTAIKADLVDAASLLGAGVPILVTSPPALGCYR
jgi:hypothetical protein